jgi:hypothetical protein
MFGINEKADFQEYCKKNCVNDNTEIIILYDAELDTYEVLFKNDGISFAMTKISGRDDLFSKSDDQTELETIQSYRTLQAIPSFDGVRVSKTLSRLYLPKIDT